MAGATTYVDPNVYSNEVVVADGVNIPALPFAVCLVGVGSRNKRITNEAVIRGAVKQEALTVSATPGAHTASLANRSDRSLDSTTLYKVLNGITTIVPDQYVTFNPASVTGSFAGPVNLTTNNAIALEMDGHDSVTIAFFASPGAVTFIGRQINVPTIPTIGAATIAQIATAINTGLGDAGATALGYGPAYANVASVSSTFLKLTSPAVQPDASTVGATNSDVRVFAAPANNATTTIFGSAFLDAASVININNIIWSAGASWKIDYVKLVGDTDALALGAGVVQNLAAVGIARGGSNYRPLLDYVLNSATSVDWSPDTAASLTSAKSVSTFDLSLNDTIILGFDGKTNSLDTSTTDVTIDLVGMSNAPVGYVANPGGVGGDAATATNIAGNINAVLSAALGPRYKGVAQPVASGGLNYVVLTSPIEGANGSSIYVKAAPPNSASTLLFGSGTQPAMGSGKRPAVGTAYYVSYDFTRPSSGAANEYGVPYQHFSLEAVLAQVGAVSASTAGFNPLAIAASIAWDNGANFIYTVQVNDTSEGNPTRSQVKSALDGAAITVGTTEVIVVGEPGTRLDVTTDMVDHLETECASTEAHPRRIFNGMSNDSVIGDRGTPNSIVGRATRTLQVSPSSPGRGRMFLIAPPQQAGVTRTLTFEDASTARVSLDATYMAVAVAAKRTALPGPAETLTRRTITGFNTDDILQPWKPAERRAMAGNGVLVITYDAGRFKMLDAMSTEGGGGGLEQFQVDSTSYQKDVVVTKVNQALDDNVIGIVPFDLATFLLDIKLIIQGVVAKEVNNGTIGPFRDNDGNIRAIDLRTDIRVAQDPNSKTTYLISYFFLLRYPALRIYAQYSVDQPFFSALAA